MLPFVLLPRPIFDGRVPAYRRLLRSRSLYSVELLPAICDRVLVSVVVRCVILLFRSRGLPRTFGNSMSNGTHFDFGTRRLFPFDG